MLDSLQEICEKARVLPELEKLALVDALLEQLDRPDPELDRAWTEEALKRRQAFREGGSKPSATKKPPLTSGGHKGPTCLDL